MKRFDDYFEWLMGWEGEVYENDPDDPGGATKYGIDQRSHPGVNIRALTRAKAKAIYEEEYWLPVRAHQLGAPLDWVLADIAVNNGKQRAITWLQELLKVTPDGKFGPITLRAARPQSYAYLADQLIKRRHAFYLKIARGRKTKFLGGWLNRNNDLRRVLDLSDYDETNQEEVVR